MQKVKKASKDLTQGNILPLLVRFSLPILAGQLFQHLYNSVDSIVVGQFVGTTALAAVTSCGDIAHLLVGFFVGLSTGAGVLFSRFFGAREYDRLHDAIHTTLMFAAILGTAMAVLGIALTPWLLRIVACPDDVLPEAKLYLQIYLIGVIFTSIYNIGTGILRAIGNSKDPLKYLILSSSLNIVLDLVLVAWFRMGVAGAALATVISQVTSVLLVFYNMLTTNDVHKVSFRDMRLDGRLLLEILDLGLPAAVQSCLTGISNLFVQHYINLLGSSAMAGIGAAKKLDKFVGVTVNAVGLSLTTFVSQNVGAKSPKRAIKGIHTSLVLCAVMIAAMGVPIILFTKTVLSVFTDDPNALEYGVKMVHIMMPLFFLQMLNSIYSNTVRGFGRSRLVMVLSLLGMVGMRQLFLTLAIHVFHVSTDMSVYFAYPVGWFFSALFVMLYYLIMIRRRVYDDKEHIQE